MAVSGETKPGLVCTFQAHRMKVAKSSATSTTSRPRRGDSSGFYAIEEAVHPAHERFPFLVERCVRAVLENH